MNKKEILEKLKICELKTITLILRIFRDGINLLDVKINDQELEDLLVLKEYDQDYNKSLMKILCKITYIPDNPDSIKEGFVVMHFLVLEKY